MQLGFHVNKSLAGSRADFAESLEVASEMLEGFKGFAQIFVHGPRDHHPIITTAQAREIANTNLKLIIHGSYQDYPWKKSAAAIAGIRNELRILDELDGVGLVIHLGQEAESRELFLEVLEHIDENLELSRPRRLFLETNVVTPEQAIFADPKRLVKLMRIAKSRKYANIKIGLCLDTAHLHSCGVRLSTRIQAKQFLQALPTKVKYILHLNDSAYQLGAGKDQHERLGTGKIWSSDMSGLEYFISWARRTNTPIILERHPDILEADLRLIRKIIKND